MKNKTYKVIIAWPHEKAEVYMIPANTDVLRKIVGGVMEFTNPIAEDVTVITNDNSIALGMEPNRFIRDEDGFPVDVYCGPMIIIGETEDGDFRSLTDTEIFFYLMAYGEPDLKRPRMKKEKQKLNYHVIASGSSGNAVRIGGIMVDCGVGFTEMKEDLYQVDTLLITHAHSDHVKPSTLESIRREFPRIKVYGNADVAYRYDVDKVVGTMPFDLSKGRHIIPFDGHHDIPVTGYIIQQDGMNILYMTDSNKVEMPVDIPLDYIFLESNYDERKLTEIGKRYAKGSYDPIANAHRHLSTQQCREFYYVHRRDRDSELIELHKSSRFY